MFRPKINDYYSTVHFEESVTVPAYTGSINVLVRTFRAPSLRAGETLVELLHWDIGGGEICSSA